MSGALYRKYRPRKFEDVIDQRHITSTIQNSIKNSTFAHAYLLTGPRGVGKTTVARLFAYSVNGLDYTEGQTYSDIIEIDAASNRRIDEIRELREKINIAPSLLKYKVYIIDEVHMLTREAFNALLKTLEEPPEHAIFILATTDFHKVPDTIVSRCVRFSFSSISVQSAKKHLSHIADKEKIKIEDDALTIIANGAEGSFRDAISLLDQFRGGGKPITAEYVSQTLGLSSTQSLDKLLEAVRLADAKSVMEQLSAIRESGSNDAVLVKQLSARVRDSLAGLYESNLSPAQLSRLADNLLKIHDYADVGLALEITLIEAAVESQPSVIDVGAPTPTVSEPPKKKNGVSEKPQPIQDDSSDSKDPWQSILARLKGTNSTLYGIARMADAKYDGDKIELYFKFPFHYKQMSIERNRMLLQKTAQDVNAPSEIAVKLSQEGGESVSDAAEPLKNISNIFGSAEVIES